MDGIKTMLFCGENRFCSLVTAIIEQLSCFIKTDDSHGMIDPANHY